LKEKNLELGFRSTTYQKQ